MKHLFKPLIAMAAATAVVVAAGPAMALTKAEIGCHAAIGKSVSKYQAALAKNLVGCHKARSAGKIGGATLCNTTAGADTKGKLGKAQSKTTDGITKKCLLTGDAETGSEAVLALYPRCPSPVKTADDGGLSDGIDTFTELATCQMRLSEAYINKIGEEVMGEPMTLPLSKEAAGCQGAIGKALSKAAKTIGGTYTKCQALDEKKNGGDLNYDTCVASGDSKGKAAATITALKDAINGSCGTAALPDQAAWIDFGGCGQSQSQTVACAVDRVANPTLRGLAGAALELPATCASFADVLINAGDGQKLTRTQLDSGWTGFAHNVDVPDQSIGGVELANCDADCENCDVLVDPYNGFCRCENNPQTVCSTIEGADAACGGGDCHCMFGPPLPLSAGGTAVCVVNRFAEEFTGQTGVVGEYDVGTRTRALVHLGTNAATPCPTCSDTSLNDGVKGGTCDGGPSDGNTCDSNALHSEFGATSFDCPPDIGANISGAGLNLALEFSSGTKSITAGLAAPFCNSGTCHCSHCTGDATVGCTQDTDCSDVGAGTCGVNLNAANPNQNQCDGGPTDCLANVNGDGLGTCQTGPFDTYCDGFLRADGRGIIPCTTTVGQCDPLDADCPGGDCGECTLGGERSCFLPTITATGEPGIFNSTGVSSFCSAATSNVGVNASGGLPGPGRVQLDFDFDLWCSDHTTQYQLPAGSNCP